MMDSAAAPPIETCPNCSTSLLGSHCHECGQKKIDTDEYSLKRFIGRAINDFTDLESNKVVRTLSAMIVRPGLLAAEYLAGRRGSYLGPLKLYLTFSALYFLFAWTVLSEVRGSSAQRIARHPASVSMAKQRGLDPKRFRRQDSGEGGEICEWAKGFQCADLGNVFGCALFQDEEVLRRTPGVFVVLLFV